MKARRELNSLGLCAKYLMFVMNFIFFLCGCAIVGVGIWILLERNYMAAIFGSHLMTAAAYIVIIGGGVIVGISFCGCIGSVQERKCMIMTYFVSVLAIFIILLIAGILALIFRSQIGEEVMGAMDRSLQRDYGVKLENSYNRYITEAWDKAQSELYCCSVRENNWEKYRQSEWYKLQPGIPEVTKPFVPVSCCVYNQYREYVDQPKCQTSIQGPPGIKNGNTNEALHYRGCYYAGREFVMEYTGYIAGIGFGIGLSMMFGMAFSIILYLQLSRN